MSGKSDYKKVSSGPEVWIKCDLDVLYYLSRGRQVKRWMKRRLTRYERRIGRRCEDASSEPAEGV